MLQISVWDLFPIRSYILVYYIIKHSAKIQEQHYQEDTDYAYVNAMEVNTN
jgi:hypothetical protein